MQEIPGTHWFCAGLDTEDRNLLVSLEMYRVQEEQAVKTLSELLSACGISMSEDEIRQTDTAQMQERVKKEASL